jgi:hypothetical protein
MVTKGMVTRTKSMVTKGMVIKGMLPRGIAIGGTITRGMVMERMITGLIGRTKRSVKNVCMVSSRTIGRHSLTVFIIPYTITWLF